jgi:hypothetical protein
MLETNRSNPTPQLKPRMSILGLLFFMLGTPNIYAALQRQSDNVTYGGGNVPRYALVVLVAVAIAGLVEMSVVGAA